MRPADLLPTLDDLARLAVRRALEPSDENTIQPGPALFAVDATAGNGHDTLFLARLLRDRGTVYAFDVQDAALNATRSRLAADGLDGHVRLIAAGHEHAAKRLPENAHGRVSVVMFNLGFLPGSDKRVITRPGTTLQALEDLMRLAAPRAVFTLHLYTGHAGGAEESAAVLDRTQSLDRNAWRVLLCSQHNKIRRAEHLLLLEKRGEPPCRSSHAS